MTEFDRWGPWTGNALHVPKHPPYSSHRAWTKPAFLVLCIVAICLGIALALAGYDAPQL